MSASSPPPPFASGVPGPGQREDSRPGSRRGSRRGSHPGPHHGRRRWRGSLGRRLYLQVYLALVVAVTLVVAVASGLWWLAPRDRDTDLFLTGMGSLVGASMPAPSAPDDEQRRALVRLAAGFNTNLTLVEEGGRTVAAVGPEIRVPRLPADGNGVVHAPGRGMVWVLTLPDGRRLLADHARHRHQPFGALLLLALAAGALALACLPVAKRLVRRLERLRAAVDDLGRGDLAARVPVEGRDEVAGLALSFNRAAARIERLVHAQKEALATASHELRSPLARMKVALELLGDGGRDDVRRRIARDIDELDGLIGEILLASRLDASPAPAVREAVELLALVAEEGARVGADVGGRDAVVHGDPRLLARLVRNLFENARRYGSGSAIEAEVQPRPGGGATLAVHDRGPGIPEAERERVFEAFYRRAGTAEGDGGGVGLGLALVRSIAAAHGGTARALTREGGGTTMLVELPGATGA